jgi:Phytanoyl-CoA dioxygenase (PhyH)
MEIIRQQITPSSVALAREWILSESFNPSARLEPEFDIDDHQRTRAKKIRKLYFYDPVFWSQWMSATGLAELVNLRFRKPKLIKHAAFIKWKKDESFIPLHQDIALWEKPYKTAFTFWVALTESKRENGGMFYSPGPCQTFRHELDINYPMFKTIDVSEFSNSGLEIMDLNLEPGDIAIWPANTPHGSHINEIGTLRVGTPFVFVESDEFDEMNAEGKIL